MKTLRTLRTLSLLAAVLAAGYLASLLPAGLRGLVVAGLLDPAWRVELEVEAATFGVAGPVRAVAGPR